MEATRRLNLKGMLAEVACQWPAVPRPSRAAAARVRRAPRRRAAAWAAQPLPSWRFKFVCSDVETLPAPDPVGPGRPEWYAHV